MKLTEKQKKLLIIGGISLFVVILIVTAVIILLRQDSTGTNNGTTKDQIELTYWGLWEPESVVQPLIDEFENQYPNIKINYSKQEFTNYDSRLYQRLSQSLSSSEPAPDIMRINNTWLPKYQKYLYPLPTTIMTAQVYEESFYPTAIEDFTGTDGKIYAIPLEIDGLCIIYNKQLLSRAGVETPPEDWDSLVELASKLTIKDSAGRITQSGLAIGTSRNITHSADIFNFLLLQNGVEPIDTTNTVVSITDSKSEGTLSYYTDFALGDDAIWSSTLKTDLELFYDGKLAMMFAPSWRAFDIIESAPKIEFDLAPLPQLPNNPEIYYSMYWGDTVSLNTQYPVEAWTFVKFMSEQEQQLNMYSYSSQVRAFGEPYSLVELNSEMEGERYVSAVAQMAPYMKSWKMGDQGFVEATINQAITDVAENNVEIETALKNAQADINDQLAQTNQ